MTSVNTNAAATTALRTLQMTNKALETTQSRVSTGLKIGEAKDNAAYWAISTTLQSDNKSLSTVKDALGLGAATVDTAYQGLNKAKEVLDEIKSKLTAATQDGVDRNVIQKEISELQKQLTSIATSSTFSGENWLSVNSEAVGYNSDKKIVASFSRDVNNNVTIGTVDVDTSNVSLYDASTVTGAAGILDKATSLKDATGRDLTYGGVAAAAGNTSAAGLVAANVVGAVSGTAATAATGTAAVATTASSTSTNAALTTAAVTLATANSIVASDTLTFEYTTGGAVRSVTVSAAGYLADQTTTTTAADGLATSIQTALTNAGLTDVTVDNATNTLVFTAAATGTVQNPSTFSFLSLKIRDADGLAKNTQSNVGVAAELFTGEVSARAAQKSSAAAIVFTSIAATDTVAFDLTIDGVSVKANVLASNGTGTSNIANLVAALNNNSTFAQYATAAVDPANAGFLRITSGTSGAASSVKINSVGFFDSTGTVKTLGTASQFSNIQAAATTTGTSFISTTLDADDSIIFDINVNGIGTKTVTIDQALVNKTLGAAANGTIGTIANYKAVIEAALTAASVTGVTVTAGATALTFSTTSKSGTDATIVMSDLLASKGGNQLSVSQIDISSAALTAAGATTSEKIGKTLTAYIALVNDALAAVTTAASNLGSVSSRIDLQKSFVDTLIDTIDEGVGNLIDSDLTEESTRLQALQTKQQLGIQALSIANASTQNVLSLFQ